MRTTHFIPVGDEQIALDWSVPQTPQGERVAVFVHGFASHRRGEKACFFAEQFCAAGWHFLSLDLRGHGDSGGSMESLTLSGCIADLAAALDWLPDHLTPPLLISSSMGAAVAAWYQLRHSVPVAGLACIAPSFTFPHSFAAELNAAALAAWRESGFYRIRNEWLDVRVGYALLEDAANYPPEQLVAGLNVPTLIFHGMRDDAVPWQFSQHLLETCPSAALELLLIKAGDHRLTDYKAYMFDSMLAWSKRL